MRSLDLRQHAKSVCLLSNLIGFKIVLLSSAKISDVKAGYCNKLGVFGMKS